MKFGTVLCKEGRENEQAIEGNEGKRGNECPEVVYDDDYDDGAKDRVW
jgi:hypothetical protein